MSNRWLFKLVPLAALVLMAACRDDSTPLTSTQTAVSVQSPTPETLGKPQPKLPTLRLWIGTNELTAEIARTIPEIQTGMMWRTNLAEMEGMLFVFTQPQRVSFWMRNTLLPLSCAYIDPEGVILELHEMNPRDDTPIPSVSDRVQYVLEVNQGWFGRHNVQPGMLATTEHGPLATAFFRR